MKISQIEGNYVFFWNHFNKNKDIKVLCWAFEKAEVLIRGNNSYKHYWIMHFKLQFSKNGSGYITKPKINLKKPILSILYAMICVNYLTFSLTLSGNVQFYLAHILRSLKC